MSEQVCTHMKDLREDCQMCGRAVEHLRASSDTRQHRSQADRDDLAAILEAHEMSMDYESYRGCACSPAPYPQAPAISQQDHAAHVAQMVLESDWLRGVRAKELRDAADDLRPKASVKNVLKARLAPMRMAAIWDCAEWLADRADRVDAEDGGR